MDARYAIKFELCDGTSESKILKAGNSKKELVSWFNQNKKINQEIYKGCNFFLYDYKEEDIVRWFY